MLVDTFGDSKQKSYEFRQVLQGTNSHTIFIVE